MGAACQGEGLAEALLAAEKMVEEVVEGMEKEAAEAGAMVVVAMGVVRLGRGKVVAATATAAVVTAMEGGEMVVVVLGEVKMVVGRAGKGRTAVVEKASEAVVIVVAS